MVTDAGADDEADKAALKAALQQAMEALDAGEEVDPHAFAEHRHELI